MDKYWQRIWCTHCWLSVGLVDLLSVQWECHKCGKVKMFSPGYMPLSYTSDHTDAEHIERALKA